MINKKLRTVVVVESPYGGQYVYEKETLGTDYVILSNPITVEFEDLPAEDVIRDKLTVLENAEQELRCRFALKLEEISTAKEKLLSITHQGE